MLIKLSVDQIADNWNFIRPGLEIALPPTVGSVANRMSNIFTSLLTGRLEAWVSVEKAEKRNEITGFVITQLLNDDISGTKSLLIYAVYGLSNSSQVSWEEGLKTIQDYAHKNTCHRIIAYSEVESIIKFVQSKGGKAQYRLLEIPIRR